MLLKMALLRKIIYTLLLFSAHAFAQNGETVFITKSEPEDKEVKSKPFFGQVSISLPLRGNPYRDNAAYTDRDGNGISDTNEGKSSGLDYIIPDGLGIQGGYGIHLKSWVGLSANTGIDWMATEQLVSVPVYGSIIFNPQIWEEYNVYLQFGAGHVFALGRGDLSGPYQKYRIGLAKNNEGSLFIEANRYGFPIHGRANTGNISIGLAFFDFL